MLKYLRRFKHRQEGVAVLEFAICLPFLFALLMGSIEFTRYIMIAQKTEKAAMTISDIVAQASTISHADIDNIINAASQVMQPYTFSTNGYVIISSVTQTGTYSITNPPLVNWQYTSSGTNGSWTQPSKVGTTGQPAALPTGFTLFDKDNIIVAEVFYNYQPMYASNGIISGGSIYKLGLYKPRLGDLSTLSALPFLLAFNGDIL